MNYKKYNYLWAMSYVWWQEILGQVIIFYQMKWNGTFELRTF